MSNPDYVKGECRHCGGHLEFPADSTGETIPCPHCGQPTELVSSGPPNRSGRFWPILIAALCLIIAGAAGGFFYHAKIKRSNVSAPSPAAPGLANGLTTAAPTAAVAPKRQIKAQTNDFAILPYKLEQTPGSSLVYVTGTVQNLSDRQRFGVKIEFGLSDTNDIVIGSATDYQSILEPHAEWRFKALVMESKAAAVQFNSISEDK